jgi:hypothetical protein
LAARRQGDGARRRGGLLKNGAAEALIDDEIRWSKRSFIATGFCLETFAADRF